MKKLLYKSLPAIGSVIVLVSIISTLLGGTAYAASGSNFNPGRIIDDVVFYDSGSMSVSSIQKFLESKVPNCDYNGTQSAADMGYPSITHAKYAEYKRNGTNGFKKDTAYHTPPYKCLTKYSQKTPQMEAASGYCAGIGAGTRTAAQIIKDVASACGINPQVLIVLLEKEQSLITDNWPLNRQLRSATGFACPDTAPCNPDYEGFFYQAYNAARQFKVYRAYPNNYNYVPGRTNKIYWQTNLGNWKNSSGNYSSSRSNCGYSNVYIENQATAALYVYTPYRPNQKALTNMYGTGDSCSAYGNRNFWRIFTDWFGSTLKPGDAAIAARYDSLDSSSKSQLGTPTSRVYCGLRNDGCYQKYSNGAIVWSKNTGAWESYGPLRQRWLEIGYENGQIGYPTSAIKCTLVNSGCYQKYEGGAIVWTSPTGAWESQGNIRAYWATLGYENSSLGYPIGPERATSTGGWYQKYQNGYIIGKKSTGYWESYGAIRERWTQLGYETGQLGYPISNVRCNLIDDGCYQKYEGGAILHADSIGAWESTGNIRNRWAQLGYETGILGFPIGPEKELSSGGWYQKYQNGYIIGKKSTGYWESYGAIRDKWASLGYQEGSLGYPIGQISIKNSTTKYQQYQHNKIYLDTTSNTTSVGP